MLNNQQAYKRQVLNAMMIILGIAMVISVCSTVFAANDSGEVASFRTMGTAVIKGSENVPFIDPIGFIQNIWKNTGINQILNGEIPAAEHVAAEDPFAGIVAPGWQKLLMMAVGFLIVYLGAFRGFEPLLLIPIGFGTILVNVPGAGMFNEGTGMLRIIYDAGVGNEFFPMLIINMV